MILISLNYNVAKRDLTVWLFFLKFFSVSSIDLIDAFQWSEISEGKNCRWLSFLARGVHR